eukprot:scaffold10171_cov446-Chaetoceros_neogracile.AAC.22
MGKGKQHNRSEQKLRSLLNRIQTKQVQTNIPFDEASSGLGKQIGSTFISMYMESHQQDRDIDEWRKMGIEIIQIFGTNVGTRGVMTGFFHQLVADTTCSSNEREGDSFMHWWIKTIRDSEEEDAGYSHLLAVSIRTYVAYAQRAFSARKSVSQPANDFVSDGSNDHFRLAHLFHQLKFSRTRQCLIRACIHSAFQQHHGRTAIEFLSPIFYLVVVSSMLSSSSEREEATLFVSLLLQEARQVIIRNSDGAWNLIAWLATSLDSLFGASVSLSNTEHVRAALELGFDFVTQLCDLSVFALLRQEDAVLQQKDGVGKIINTVIRSILHCVRYDGHFAPSLQPALQQLITILSIRGDSKAAAFHLESSTIYSLGIGCLMMQDENDVASMLIVLLLLVKNAEGSGSSHMVYGVLTSIGYIFQALPSCSRSANSLIALAKTHKVEVSEENPGYGLNGICHIFDSFESPKNRMRTLQCLIGGNGRFSIDSDMGVEGQCEHVLLGLSLICIFTRDALLIPEIVYSFLGQLISKYQHLGRRCLPIMVATLEQYITIGSVECILPHLEFITTSITQDASCAHEVWSLLSSLTNTKVPINVQAMTIRLYPLLCISNRRLYSRVCESLGRYVEHPSAPLRIAAASSLCDLAEEDLIRDVTEIIGWVQTFLIDEEHMVTHFAVRTLHHLIKAEELDFSMVIKVLNKKLVTVDDAEAIMKLPDIVVEALVQLLGTGGDSNASSSDSDGSESEDNSDIVISQQVQAATSGLREVALMLTGSLVKQNAQLYYDHKTTVLLVKLVYESLGQYSLGQIGITNDIIRADCSDTSEYDCLRKIIEQGFDASEKCHHVDTFNLDRSLIALARKVVSFEEDALGPSLWNLRTCKPFTKNTQHHDLATALEALPEANEGTVTSLVMDKLVKRAEIALESLQVLSLPSQFVGFLSKAMDTDVGEKETLTTPCISTLVAQLGIGRRSAVERRHFVALSVKVAKFPTELWHHEQLFLESLPIIIPQWSSADVDEIIPQLWSKCADDVSSDSNKCVSIFLESLTRIFETKSQKTSPAVLKSIYRTVLTKVFSSVCSRYEDPCMAGVQGMLHICISKIPLEVLLEYKVLDFGDANDSSRVQLIAYLHATGVLQATDPYLFRAILWIGKQEGLASEITWILSFEIATAAVTMPSVAKREVVNALLEIMQINGSSTSCLCLLLLVSAKWARIRAFQSSGCVHGLQLLLANQQVGNVCHLLGISDVVMKRVLSLLSVSYAGNDEHAKSAFKEILFRIFISLKTPTLSLQHALVSASVSQVITSR